MLALNLVLMELYEKPRYLEQTAEKESPNPSASLESALISDTNPLAGVCSR